MACRPVRGGGADFGLKFPEAGRRLALDSAAPALPPLSSPSPGIEGLGAFGAVAIHSESLQAHPPGLHVGIPDVPDAEHIRNSAAGWTGYQAQLGARGFGGAGALQYVDQVIGSQAATLAVNDVFFALGCAFVLLVPFVWLAKPPFGARGSGAAR